MVVSLRKVELSSHANEFLYKPTNVRESGKLFIFTSEDMVHLSATEKHKHPESDMEKQFYLTSALNWYTVR